MAEEGLRIAETVDHPFSVAEACRGVSLLYLRQGNVHQAIPVLERAMGLCQDAHIPLFLPWVTAALGMAYILSGRCAAGLPLVERGVEQAVARRGWLVLVVSWLSDAYLLAGRLADALRLAERALALAQDYQERGRQAYALHLLGEIAVQHDPLDAREAETRYRQALALADELGMRPLQAHCHRGLGTLYAKISRQKQAHTELSTAIVLYRTMGMTFWLPQAEAVLA